MPRDPLADARDVGTQTEPPGEERLYKAGSRSLSASWVCQHCLSKFSRQKELLEHLHAHFAQLRPEPVLTIQCSVCTGFHYEQFYNCGALADIKAGLRVLNSGTCPRCLRRLSQHKEDEEMCWLVNNSDGTQRDVICASHGDFHYKICHRCYKGKSVNTKRYNRHGHIAPPPKRPTKATLEMGAVDPAKEMDNVPTAESINTFKIGPYTPKEAEILDLSTRSLHNSHTLPTPPAGQCTQGSPPLRETVSFVRLAAQADALLKATSIDTVYKNEATESLENLTWWPRETAQPNTPKTEPPGEGVLGWSNAWRGFPPPIGPPKPIGLTKPDPFGWEKRTDISVPTNPKPPRFKSVPPSPKPPRFRSPPQWEFENSTGILENLKVKEDVAPWCDNSERIDLGGDTPIWEISPSYTIGKLTPEVTPRQVNHNMADDQQESWETCLARRVLEAIQETPDTPYDQTPSYQAVLSPGEASRPYVSWSDGSNSTVPMSLFRPEAPLLIHRHPTQQALLGYLCNHEDTSCYQCMTHCQKREHNPHFPRCQCTKAFCPLCNVLSCCKWSCNPITQLFGEDLKIRDNENFFSRENPLFETYWVTCLPTCVRGNRCLPCRKQTGMGEGY